MVGQVVLLYADIIGDKNITPTDLRNQSYAETPYGTWETQHEIWHDVSKSFVVQDLMHNELSHDNIYFLLIHCGTHFDVLNPQFMHYMPIESLEKIAKHNVHIIFDYSFEMLHRDILDCSYPLLRHILAFLNPAYSGKFIVSSCNDNVISSLVPGKLVNYHTRFVSLPFWVWKTKQEFLRDHPNLPTADDVVAGLHASKDYLFVNLNRNPRLARISFIHGLRAMGLMQHGLVSLLKNGKPIDTTIAGANEFVDIHSRDYHEDDEFIHKLKESIVQYLDVVGVDVDPVQHSNHIKAETYTVNTRVDPTTMNRACFEIVSETSQQDMVMVGQPINTPAITEKVVKTMLYGRPFMVSGDAGILQRLLDLGFMTCPFLFDEEYDNEKFLVNRQHMIMKNISKWVGRHGEFMGIANRFQHVFQHNRQRVIDFPIGEIYKDILLKAIVDEDM